MPAHIEWRNTHLTGNGGTRIQPEMAKGASSRGWRNVRTAAHDGTQEMAKNASNQDWRDINQGESGGTLIQPEMAVHADRST